MKKKVKNVLCVCLAALLLVACGNTAPSAGSSSAVLTSPEMKEDFYAAVNADWLASATIPADKPAVGGFMDLSEGVEKTLMADFADMLSGKVKPDNEELASFIELYRLAADFDTRNASGSAPLQPYLEKVENLTSLAQLNAQWAQWDVACMPSPFATTVMADMGDAATNALYAIAPSLFLMDKSYYADEATKEMMQGGFSQMSTNLLVLAGKSQDEAAEIVKQALQFDESLVPYIRSAEEASDYTKMYNPTSFADFDAQVEGFDFTAAFTELLGQAPQTIILTNPEYFAAMDKLVNEETFAAMKSWMMVSTVNSFSGYLGEDFRLESGSFGRMMSGMAEATAPEKSAYSLAAGMFGEVVGIYYGKTYLGEEAKQDVTKMVDTFVSIYEDRISANTWLSEETRAMAIKKLQSMSINIGYPDKARPIYSQMKTVPMADGGTLIGNAMEFARITREDNYSMWNTPVERGLWPLSADTVNAMYSAMDNSINFTAAILQAPLYSLQQPNAANYGGIGAIIAHEISHAFDPNGSKFDELGNLTDWWTKEDYAKFDELSKAMVAEFDGLEYAGGAVNGTMTVAENVADSSGLACALQAAKMQENPDLEAFFINWAVIWRQKSTPEYEAMLLTMDVHAPNHLRANIQLQNMDEFYTTFDINESDTMYRAPEDRVIIW